MNYGKKVKPEANKKMKPIPQISSKDQIVPRAPGILESNIRAFKGSVKSIKSLEFWKIAAFDALTLIFIWIIILIGLLILDKVSIPVIESDAASQLALQSGNMDKYSELQILKEQSLLKLERIQWIIFGLAAVLIVLAITIFHDAGWYFAKKKEFGMKNIGSRYLANLFWVIKWVIIFTAIFVTLPINIGIIFIIFGLLIFTYADPAYRNLYDDQRSPVKNAWNGFQIAFSKPYRYVPFLLSLFIMLFFIVLILTLIQSIPILFMIVSAVCLLIVIGWMRHYILILG